MKVFAVIILVFIVVLCLLISELVKQAKDLDTLHTLLAEAEEEIEELHKEIEFFRQGGGGSKS